MHIFFATIFLWTLLLSLEANFLKLDANFRRKIPPTAPRGGVNALNLTNFRTGLLIAKVRIGTPPQEFLLGFDFELSNSWIIRYGLKIDDWTGLHNKTGFSQNALKTAKEVRKTFIEPYAHGSVVCDLMTISEDMPRLNFCFGVVDGLEYDTNLALNSDPVDGYMSLMPGERTTLGIPSFLSTINNFVGEPIVSIASDASHDKWNFHIDTVQVSHRNGTINLSSSLNGGKHAEIIATSSMLSAPRAMLSAILKAIGVRKYGNMSTVHCSLLKTGPDLMLVVGEHKIEFSPSDYIEKLGNWCFALLWESADDNWLLGGALLQKRCLALDNKTHQLAFGKYISHTDSNY